MMKRTFKVFAKQLIKIFEYKIAPKITIIYWPFYRLCKSLNICFVVNMSSGIGHTPAELDYFLRRKRVNDIDLNKKYVLIRPRDPFAKVFITHYRHYFFYASSNYFLYHLLFPLLIQYKKITLDVGLARVKFQLRKPSKSIPLKQNYFYQLSKKENFLQWIDYYRLQSETTEYYPLTNYKKSKNTLLEQLNIEGKPLVLIHIKASALNASPMSTDPTTYLKALDLLQDLNYQPIFIGREQMPATFHSRSIINYAESGYASVENDIFLFEQAELSIIAGSGVSFLADVYNKHYLYINSWQLPMPMFSKKCVAIPALVTDQLGNALKFDQQIALYTLSPDQGDELFPSSEYLPRNTSQDEIYEGVQELLQLKSQFTPLKPLQHKFNTLNKEIPLYHTHSRCAEYFLQKHQHLL